MSTTKEEMQAEALRRLEALVRAQGLNPKVPGCFQEGKVYYSYLTAGGFLGSIDTIEYDPRYARLLQDCQHYYGGLGYHAIETGGTLAVLYVSPRKEEWPHEFDAQRGYVMANVCDPEADYDEFGMIQVVGYQGALVRVG